MTLLWEALTLRTESLSFCLYPWAGWIPWCGSRCSPIPTTQVCTSVSHGSLPPQVETAFHGCLQMPGGAHTCQSGRAHTEICQCRRAWSVRRKGLVMLLPLR